MKPFNEMEIRDLRMIMDDPTMLDIDRIWASEEYKARKKLGCPYPTAVLLQDTLATMGYGWSYQEYLNQQNASIKLPDGVSVNLPKEKECRCESLHLFAFGHEKQCDYFEGKK